jgi:uncharacterized membrane protein
MHVLRDSTMTHAVKTVIRLIAAGIFIVAAMNVGVEYLRGIGQGEDTNSWRVSLSIMGVVLGVVLFFTSKSIANRLTDDVDDDPDDNVTDESKSDDV